MPIVIREIVTEVVVRGTDEAAAPGAAMAAAEEDADAREEALIRSAAERVVEILRREWER